MLYDRAIQRGARGAHALGSNFIRIWTILRNPDKGSGMSRRSAGAGGDDLTSDPYIIGRQLGSDGREKSVYESRSGANGPKVALAQFKTRSSKVQPALRSSSGHIKSRDKIRCEAEFQRRASAAGLAPALIEVDLERSRLVMDLLPGGTLLDLARSQGGSLTAAQQRRIVELLKRLGTDTHMLHNDCGNPANFLADGAGELFVIDFGMSKEMGASHHPHANMHAIRHLLFDVQQGLITHGILKVAPSTLVREYEAFLASLHSEASSAPAPAAAAAPIASGQGDVLAPPAKRQRTTPRPQQPQLASTRNLRSASKRR